MHSKWQTLDFRAAPPSQHLPVFTNLAALQNPWFPLHGRSITQAWLVKSLPSADLQPIPLPQSLCLVIIFQTSNHALVFLVTSPMPSATSHGIIIQKTLITLEIPRVLGGESQETRTKIKYLFFMISQLGSPIQSERVSETGGSKGDEPLGCLGPWFYASLFVSVF